MSDSSAKKCRRLLQGMELEGMEPKGMEPEGMELKGVKQQGWTMPAEPAEPATLVNLKVYHAS